MSKDKLRILFVTTEIDPFLKISDAADLIRLLPQKLQERGHEIRILMPKFGVINERRNRLHEVVRLSGINIRVGEEEKPLTIKVASIPNAKLQVYFLDNVDYFQRKSVMKDPKSNKFHDDNGERAIFFCKGVIETVKKLGWQPDIIHCHDWMSSFIPLYLRTHYKNDPMFKNTKVVVSVFGNGQDGKVSKDFLRKTNIDFSHDGKASENFNENSYYGIAKGGLSMADAIAVGHPEIDGKLQDFINSVKKVNTLYSESQDSDNFIDKYQELYTTILN